MPTEAPAALSKLSARLARLQATDIWMLAPFLLLLAFNIARYFPFYSDDSLISLRYSQRLLAGQGLTWTSGTPVEGYTNLLWVLGVAFLGKLGMELVFASRVLGILCSAVCALALVRLPVRGNRAAQEAGKLTSVALLAMSGTTAAWAIGGLEQPLVAACLSCAILAFVHLAEGDKPSRKFAALAGIGLALMCLTRPDSPIFVVSLAGALVVGGLIRKQRIDWGTVALLVGLPLLAYVGQTLFRHAYYGQWLPNTARVKFKPSPEHLHTGLIYLREGFLGGAPLYAVGLLCIARLFRRGQTVTALALAGSAALWSAYVAVIGGDIFAAFRHFTPLIVIAAFAVALDFGSFVGTIKRPWGAAVIALVAAWLLVIQATCGQIRRAEFERFEWEGKDLALTLKRGLGDRKPVLAVTAAGCLPYWSGFECIDMLGLNDDYISSHPPKTFGSGWIGHELGSGSYVLGRRPDLIVYNVGTLGDSFRTGRELEAMPEFMASYTPVMFRIPSRPGYEGAVWMNRHSPKIGYVRKGDTLTIPGYLVNKNKMSRVTASPTGELETEVSSQVPAKIELSKSELPPAPYAITVAGEGEAVITSHTLSKGNLQIVVSTSDARGFRLRQLIVAGHRG